MTQEEKDLLLKDLCGRLPYGVKCEVYNCIGVLDEVTSFYGVGVTYNNGQDTTCRIDECKPYLFPLSSMTDEQKEEFIFLHSDKQRESGYSNLEIIIEPCKLKIDWLDKNHFDYRGLIPMGLAINATGKNIY